MTFYTLCLCYNNFEVMLLTTVYIDVYFFINLTVDVLSAYFAAKALHMHSSIRRLVFIGTIGGILAVLDVIINPPIIMRIASLVLLLSLSGMMIARGASLKRRTKFMIAFLFFEVFIGGGVYYGYLLIERYMSEFFIGDSNVAERRELITLSVLILFVIGVLKLLIMVLGGDRFVRSVRLRIEIEGKCEELDALVDSGNLVRDPMNMCPVLFVKKAAAKRLLPMNVVELSNIDGLGGHFRKRIRLIPVTRNGKTHVMTGVRTDKVSIIGPDGEDEVMVTLAIDKEEGSFGGYDALLPSSVMQDGI